jgi:hypothetical protein
MPALGLVGFVFSAVLGGYLVIEYMIEREWFLFLKKY